MYLSLHKGNEIKLRSLMRYFEEYSANNSEIYKFVNTNDINGYIMKGFFEMDSLNQRVLI